MIEEASEAQHARLARSQRWVRELVHANGLSSPWGFAIYYDPLVAQDRLDDCQSRRDGMLRWAKDAVGCDAEHAPPFTMQPLDWPEEDDEESNEDFPGIANDAHVVSSEAMSEYVPYNERGSADLASSAAQSDEWKAQFERSATVPEDELAGVTSTAHPFKVLQLKHINDDVEVEEDGDDDADIELVAEFAKLRTHFKWVRDYAEKRRKQSAGGHTRSGGLHNGILDNVFLAIDRESVDSILAPAGSVDDAWVWAIDPEFPHGETRTDVNGLTEVYLGYMRVRVQQLVNNFYEARRFRADEVSLEHLWRAAQPSRLHAFVSLDASVAKDWKFSRDIGSALRAGSSQMSSR